MSKLQKHLFSNTFLEPFLQDRQILWDLCVSDTERLCMPVERTVHMQVATAQQAGVAIKVKSA